MTCEKKYKFCIQFSKLQLSNRLYSYHFHYAAQQSLITAEYNAIKLTLSSLQQHSYPLSAVPISLLTAQHGAIKFLYPVHNITTIQSAVPLSLITAQHSEIQLSVSSSQHYNYPLSPVPLWILTEENNGIQFFVYTSQHYNYPLSAVPLSLLKAEHNGIKFSVFSSQH